MALQERNGEQFYQYAMELFSLTGHVSTLEPVFINHSAEQFVYFDSQIDPSLSREQRSSFRLFDNISRLFAVNDCVFFSINLLSAPEQRSQVAHDVHTMIHPLSGAKGTICLFRYDREVMITLMGYGKRCILSDWYPMDDDYNRLADRLDIGNCSITNGYDYFSDLVYCLARPYYLEEQNLPAYSLLPIDFLSRFGFDDIDREEIDQMVRDQLSAAEREYGDDYVAYDETVAAASKSVDISADLDLMLLEMDIEDDNPFGEEIETEDDFEDDEEYSEETDRDEYEFDDVDPEIFRDPTLMVKWLKKQEPQ